MLGSSPAAPFAASMPGEENGLEAGDRVGPYRLLRPIGSGGMADVWLAERDDGAFAREVALKLPLVSRLRRDLAVRFARERDILARLEHPHIARFYDAGVSADGLPYLAMEYVDGRPITTWCDEHRVDLAGRIQLFAQVLSAVQFAHANLVIHRDLKPSNILVTDDGQVRLLDFGIAKLLAADEERAPETQLTRSSGRALTPEYASPEQMRGEALTIASDVYSLGVVLFEVLVGSRPYRLKIESAAQLEEAILAADPLRPSANVTDAAAASRGVSPRRLAKQLAGDLDTVVLKALAKSPGEPVRDGAGAGRGPRAPPRRAPGPRPAAFGLVPAAQVRGPEPLAGGHRRRRRVGADRRDGHRPGAGAACDRAAAGGPGGGPQGDGREGLPRGVPRGRGPGGDEREASGTDHAAGGNRRRHRPDRIGARGPAGGEDGGPRSSVIRLRVAGPERTERGLAPWMRSPCRSATTASLIRTRRAS